MGGIQQKQKRKIDSKPTCNIDQIDFTLWKDLSSGKTCSVCLYPKIKHKQNMYYKYINSLFIKDITIIIMRYASFTTDQTVLVQKLNYITSRNKTIDDAYEKISTLITEKSKLGLNECHIFFFDGRQTFDGIDKPNIVVDDSKLYNFLLTDCLGEPSLTFIKNKLKDVGYKVDTDIFTEHELGQNITVNDVTRWKKTGGYFHLKCSWL